MAMSKAAKEALKEVATQRFAKANAAIVAEYRGLKVEDLTALRVKLRQSKSEFRILKNRIAKKAIEDQSKDFEPIKEFLVGPVGLILVYGDAAQAAKSVLDFEKDKEAFSVKSAVLDGKLVSKKDLTAIASLSREVLMAQIVGSLVAPHRGLVTVLSGVTRNLVQVINAIKEKKS